jgi:hypothetical protein
VVFVKNRSSEFEAPPEAPEIGKGTSKHSPDWVAHGTEARRFHLLRPLGAGLLLLSFLGSFLAVLAAPATTSSAQTTESFSLSSAAVSGQSTVTWQNSPTTLTDPITLNGQIDQTTGAISAATLSIPSWSNVQDGENVTYTLAEVNPGQATGSFDSTTGAAALNDALSLTVAVAGYTCVSSPLNVALSGTYDATTSDVTLATTSSFTIPQFPVNSNCIGPVADGLNADPGGIAGSTGNALSIALHGQFAPGLPTTTTLSASPSSPQLQGTSVTLSATVAPTSGSGTPTGSVNFLDNGAPVGTSTLDNTGTATLTTSTLPAGTNQQLTAVYSGDPTYAASTSTASAYTVTPVPTVSTNLPSGITAPSTSELPTVTVVSPDAGPTSGGTSVTITGTAFTSSATVDFGSTAATDVQVQNSTTIVATSPAGTGTVDVTVTTSSGTSATALDDVFAYGAPTVTAVSPNTGPANEEFRGVTITGTAFTSSATVDFGSTPAESVTVVSPTLITAETPSEPAGTVDVTVTTPGGTSATSPADQFTFSSAPAVEYLATAAGPAAGGTSVTITGWNFTGATAVDFGSTPATSVTVSSATSIKATSPAGTSGTAVDVTVTTPSGTSATHLYDQFTYGPPTVTAISPTSGPAAGGTQVTITGTSFAPALVAADGPTVHFGTAAISASDVTVNSPTSLTVSAPAGTGTVDVTVTTGGGTSVTSPADQFTYAPTVTAVSPPSGATAGGTSVTITGTGFTGTPTVDFGTTAATDVVVESPTEITADSPAGTAGATNVTVTTSAGISAVSTDAQFFYGSPTISSVAPDAGPTTGGTSVTITGTGFAGASAVVFTSTAATSFTVVSPTEITAVSPPMATPVTTHIRVTTNGGESTAGGAANEFTYSNAPSVTSISPDTPTGASTTVTITGVNFTGASSVNFGSAPATSFTVVSSTEITAIAPSGTGAVDVTVTSASGTSATWGGDLFGYGPPTVTSVAPSTGTTLGGDNVVVSGTGFVQGGSSVSFGTVAATSVTVVSQSEIVAVSPAESAGAVDITVTTPFGTSATTSGDVFTYNVGGAPGEGSLTINNPSTGESWANLYLEINFNVSEYSYDFDGLTPSDFTVSYQDSSGTWCPLTASGTISGGTGGITTYFSGIGSTCGSAPGSFSLAPGASLTVPIELTYASDKYLGVQNVTATLYSGTCTSSTSCTQSGDLDGTVTGSQTVQVAPPGTLPTTMTLTNFASQVQQGFMDNVSMTVLGTAPPSSTLYPYGSVEYLVDGKPTTITSTDPLLPFWGDNPVTFGSEYKGKVPGTDEGTTYFSTADLSVGVHTLTIEYSGNSTYAPNTLTESFTVLPPPAGTPYTCTDTGPLFNMTTLGYVTATSSPPVPTLSGTNAWVRDIGISLDLDPAISAGATNLTTASDSPTLTLSSGGTLSAVGSNGAGGDVVTWSGLSASVPVSGSVGSSFQVTLGSMSGTSTLLTGTTMTCTPVSDGAQVATVPVAGNTLTTSPSGSATPGSLVTMTDTVSPPTSVANTVNGTTTYEPNGQVTFYDGTTNLGTVPVDYSGDAATGTASLTTGNLQLGEHQLSAVWSGGGGVPQNPSAPVSFFVGNATTTSLTSSATSPSNASNPVTFTATVAPPSGSTTAPTGTVDFTEDGNPVPSCTGVVLSSASPPTATCKLTFGPGQSHSLVASYNGDTNYIGSSSQPLTQATLPGSVTTVTSTINPGMQGTPITYTATVTPANGSAPLPTGTVSFSVDGNTKKCQNVALSGKQAVAFCMIKFGAGTVHKIFATYSGDANYSGSTSAVFYQQIVPPTTTSVSSSKATVAKGQAVTFTATVRPKSGKGPTPKGVARFVVDGKVHHACALVTLGGGGRARCSLKLARGTHHIDAVYGGSTRYGPSTSKSIKEVVKKG